MSRQLPSQPNLEHLRKQAKDLLDTARAQHPSWQLADAQFALARGYGFTSWPALKAHVDAARGTDVGPRASGASPTLDTPSSDCPLNGVWVANLTESIRHPSFQFQSATLEVRVSATRVALTQVVIDSAGQKSGSTMTIDADGMPRGAPTGGAAHTLVARWLDARTLEAIDSQDGVEAGRGRYEVSEDGQRLTVTAAGQRLVFDRR